MFDFWLICSIKHDCSVVVALQKSSNATWFCVENFRSKTTGFKFYFRRVDFCDFLEKRGCFSLNYPPFATFFEVFEISPKPANEKIILSLLIYPIFLKIIEGNVCAATYIDRNSREVLYQCMLQSIGCLGSVDVSLEWTSEDGLEGWMWWWRKLLLLKPGVGRGYLQGSSGVRSGVTWTGPNIGILQKFSTSPKGR